MNLSGVWVPFHLRHIPMCSCSGLLKLRCKPCGSKRLCHQKKYRVLLAWNSWQIIIKPEYIIVGFVYRGASISGAGRHQGSRIGIFWFCEWPGAMAAFCHFKFLPGRCWGDIIFKSGLRESKWNAYAPILLAGYSCGMGLIGMTSIAVALISKAVSQVVF